MRQFKIVVEKHPDAYVAYPLGLKGGVEGRSKMILPLFFFQLDNAHQKSNTLSNTKKDDKKCQK